MFRNMIFIDCKERDVMPLTIRRGSGMLYWLLKNLLLGIYEDRVTRSFQPTANEALEFCPSSHPRVLHNKSAFSRHPGICQSVRTVHPSRTRLSSEAPRIFDNVCLKL